MTKDEPTQDDPIVAEVRRAREEIFSRFDYDLAKYVAYLKKLETTSGRKYIKLPPRKTKAKLAVK